MDSCRKYKLHLPFSESWSGEFITKAISPDIETDLRPPFSHTAETVSMMDEWRPGPGMSGCFTWAKLPSEVPERTDWVSEVPAILASDCKVEIAVGFDDAADPAKDGEAGMPGNMAVGVPSGLMASGLPNAGGGTRPVGE
jgi:hypothetical protein